MKNVKKIDCIVCNGTGCINPPKTMHRKDVDNVFREAAEKLRKNGFTIREIVKLLGYKHPGSISHLLSKK